jgi:hypothetical protein
MRQMVRAIKPITVVNEKEFDSSYKYRLVQMTSDDLVIGVYVTPENQRDSQDLIDKLY